MDMMKLMTAMPIKIRQDLVADGAFASDSHCKISGFPIGRDLDLRAFLSILLTRATLPHCYAHRLRLRLRLHWLETSQVSTWPHQLEDVEESHSVDSGLLC